MWKKFNDLTFFISLITFNVNKKDVGIFFKHEHFGISKTFGFCTDVLGNSTSNKIISISNSVNVNCSC